MAKVMFTARIEQEDEDYLKELGSGSRTDGFIVLLRRARGISEDKVKCGVRIPATPVKPPVGTRPATPAVRQVARAPIQAPAPAPTPMRRTGFIGRK